MKQFFPKAVDHSASASYQREWFMVKGIVRDAGYPCAAVAYVQQKLDGTFTVVCKPKVRTNSFVAFSLDPDTRSVTSL